MEQITLMTVVFETEFPLLELQAKSVCAYVDPAVVAEVVVIDNSTNGMPQWRRKRLLQAYGVHRAKVAFYRAAELIRVPQASGWYVQQLLKLAVSSRVRTRIYVALDAKDHFIRKASVEDFVGANGLGKVPVHSYAHHVLRDELRRTLSYIGLPPEEYVDRFGATATPFPLETAAVKELIDTVGSNREPNDFVGEFIDHGLLEFFLYSAWLVQQRGSLESAFDVQLRSCPRIWKSTATIAGVRAALDAASTLQDPIFGVHRRALWLMPPAAVRDLAGFWTTRRLFPDVARAIWFVAGFRVSYLFHEVVRKVRESELQRRLRGS